MFVHRRSVVLLWAVECACTDGVLCGCGQLNVCVQTVVWLWAVECACTDGVLCGCGQLNVRAKTMCYVAVCS